MVKLRRENPWRTFEFTIPILTQVKLQIQGKLFAEKQNILQTLSLLVPSSLLEAVCQHTHIFKKVNALVFLIETRIIPSKSNN